MDETIVASTAVQGRTATRRAARTIIVIGCVTILLVELLVRAIASRIPEPLVWYHASAQVKVEQMEALSERGTKVDVVIVGSSQAAMGIDPIQLSDALDGKPFVYNAAVLAGYPTVNVRFVPEQVLPRLKMTTAIVGVSTGDLSSGERPRYGSTPATEEGLVAELDRSVSKVSALVRYRRELSRPDSWPSIAAGSAESEVAFYRREAIGERGLWRYAAVPRCEANAAGGAVPPGADPVWRANPERTTALWSMVDDLGSRGVKVVLAVLPISDCALVLWRNGASDEAGRAEFAADARQRHVPLIDVADQVHSDVLFQDPAHLNRAGMTVYTRLLAEKVAPLL